MFATNLNFMLMRSSISWMASATQGRYATRFLLNTALCRWSLSSITSTRALKPGSSSGNRAVAGRAKDKTLIIIVRLQHFALTLAVSEPGQQVGCKAGARAIEYVQCRLIA